MPVSAPSPGTMTEPVLRNGSPQVSSCRVLLVSAVPFEVPPTACPSGRFGTADYSNPARCFARFDTITAHLEDRLVWTGADWRPDRSAKGIADWDRPLLVPPRRGAVVIVSAAAAAKAKEIRASWVHCAGKSNRNRPDDCRGIVSDRSLEFDRQCQRVSIPRICFGRTRLDTR